MSEVEFRVLRDRLGLSASKLGVALGVTERTIFNWQSGKVGIPASVGFTMRGLVKEQEGG